MTKSSDVIVVGGGIVGAASAYFLARRGLRVTLLEHRHLAFGATGRNLGFVWLHTRRSGPELDLSMWTRRRLPYLPDELEADFDLRCNGGLIYFDRDEHEPVMREFVEQRTADGVEMRLLDRTEARELAPLLSDAVLGATYCPLDAQVDPPRYVRAFADAATRLGAEVVEGCEVEALLTDGARVSGVRAQDGDRAAEWVVLAAGAWSPSLAGPIGVDLQIGFMRLQIFQTLPMPARLQHLLYGPRAVKQYAIFQQLASFRAEDFTDQAEHHAGLAILESVCQKADGSYLMGCAMDYPGFRWEPDVAGIALVSGVLGRSFPELAVAGFHRAWAGLLPYTPDNLPIIDHVPDRSGLIIASGHVFGNAAGPATGALVADLVTNSVPEIDPRPYRIGRSGLRQDAAGSVW